MINQSKEDYIRAIYCLWEKGDKFVRSVDIASNLDISKPSVSAMLKKLSTQKYIKMQPYSQISFTAKGLREAKKLTYKHRIIEVFLHKILKYPKNKIHEEAHKLEHAFSYKAVKRLDSFLGYPKYCPNGFKIPKA